MSFQRVQQPVFIWVQGPGDPDPDYGRPAWGGGRPDNSLPGGGQIDNSLPDAPGHVWGALVRWLMRPQIDGGPAKPPGLRPVQPLPPSPGHPANRPPNGGRPPHAWTPGHWEPIDPGFNGPPLWAFIPSIDNGLPEPPEINPTPPGGPSKPPGGAWFPLDPEWGKPVRPCPPVGGKPHPPIWGWVPDRPEVEPPDTGGTTPPEGTATVSPTSGTVLASGGTVTTTVYPSTSTPDWSVTALPSWVTASPMSGSGTGTVVLTAAVNTTGMPKQALVKIGGAVFTLNQGAV